jgi:hypothetical protein
MLNHPTYEHVSVEECFFYYLIFRGLELSCSQVIVSY